MRELPKRSSSSTWALFRQFVLKTLLTCRSGRWLLAAGTTLYARYRTGSPLSVFHDGVWGHRVDGVCVPDSIRFCYFGVMIDRWVGEPQRWRDVGQRFWCVTYQPRAGDVIVDVGAGMGSDAFFFSPLVGPRGVVVAIEANPNTFTLLTKLCQWNGLDNVRCRQVAVVDQPGSIRIEDSDYHEANTVMPGGGEGSGVEVEGVRLDDLLAREGLERVDFLKMNIEGAEAYALNGMTQTLKRLSHVCIACHDFRADNGEGEFFRTREKVQNFLIEQGFTLVPPDPYAKPYIRDHVHACRS